MSYATYQFAGEVRRWVGPAAWYFVALPHDLADDIAARFDAVAAGFGSIRVQVTVGDSRWETSLFPDSKLGTYLLFVKAPIRRAEGIDDGDTVSFALRVGDIPPAAPRAQRSGSSGKTRART